MIITPRLLAINHTTGRDGHTVDMVTIHVTEGSAASVRSWFAAPQAKVSAHYMVTVNGAIDQFVDEDDTAWHNGRVDPPTAPLVLGRPHVNPNFYSIGIEHEGTGTTPLTAAQRDASAALIRDICTRRRIPIDRTHVVGHREVYALKTCPGKIDVDALVTLAARPIPVPAEAPRGAPPRIVWSNHLDDYLIVTRVASDTEWSYVRLRDLQRAPAVRATVPLSTMPSAAS